MLAVLYNNTLVYADEAIFEYEKNCEYICPCCGEPVILKAGSVNYPYFSHLRNSNCIVDYENEISEWRRYCQSLFPKQYREIIITKKYSELFPNDEDFKNDDDTETHISDICYKNYVIEFQHSPMDPDTFWNKTLFYTSTGYKLIWVFDWNDKAWNDHLDEYYYDDEISKWSVKYAPKTCSYYKPQDYMKELMICFSYNEDTPNPMDEEIGESRLKRIIWARPDKYDCNNADYSRIVTKNLGSIEELANYILSK